MKALHIRARLAFGLLVAHSALLVAVEVQTDIPFEAIDDPAPDSKLFPEIQREARRINRLIRDALLVPLPEALPDGYPPASLAAFGVLVQHNAGARLGGHQYPYLTEQLQYFAATLDNSGQKPVLLPTLTVEPHAIRPGELVLYSFTENELQQGELSLVVNPAITVNGQITDKVAAMRLLAEAIYPYQRNANAFTAYETRMKLLKLAADWDAYLEKGRPQTVWDITCTTLMEYREIKKGYLVGPPSRQWFVLHPNVVIENLDAAPDGDQLGGAVAIEWLGVNWWNLKVPFGLSVSSLYSDRPGVDDVGHGVTLYFANKYCIGWASHGGDNGFYVSLDALKFIDNKKNKLGQFREKLGKKLGLTGLN